MSDTDDKNEENKGRKKRNIAPAVFVVCAKSLVQIFLSPLKSAVG